MINLYQGDCLQVMKTFPDNSIEAVVTDPPYGLSFMGKKWDYDVPSVELWKEVLRVLKPGGYLLSFGGTRTYHRMVVNIEDAGFEIRDQIQWLYGSGFPKSLNVNKAGAGDAWEGWGTALKPANEPIVLARKPLSESTVAANVLKWGTGGINIDGCRIASAPRPLMVRTKTVVGANSMSGTSTGATNSGEMISTGRFPANILLDETAAAMLGEPSRFFYVAKASKSERNKDCEALADTFKPAAEFRPNHMDKALSGDSGTAYGRFSPTKNNHPTVKPTKLMEYLVKLVTPPNGVVLDPFMGSGTTGVACKALGVEFVGIEREQQYFEIAKKRTA